MIYFTRQEQRIIILLGVAMLLGTGVLLIKRFQPGWIMRLSMGKPDFDGEEELYFDQLGFPTDDEGTPLSAASILISSGQSSRTITVDVSSGQVTIN